MIRRPLPYHTEHHGWPSIPWHRLPDAHAAVAPKLRHCVPGYLRLHRDVLAGRHLPAGDAGNCYATDAPASPA